MAARTDRRGCVSLVGRCMPLAMLPLLVACSGGVDQVDPLLLPPRIDLGQAEQPEASDAPRSTTLSSFSRGEAAMPEVDRAPAGELVAGEDGLPVLLLPEPFLEAWRRVGLALDRAGFTVEDRNRSERRYLVRYDPAAVDDQGAEGGGFLSRLAFWSGSEPPSEPELYAVRVLADESVSRAWVTTADGMPVDPELGRRILLLALDSLR